MQKSWPVAGGGGAAGRIAQMRARRLDDRFVLRRLLDIVKQRDIVAGAGPRKVRPNSVQERRSRKSSYSLFICANCERAVSDEQWLFIQLALGGKLFQQFLSGVFRLLDVGLIERIDAE